LESIRGLHKRSKNTASVHFDPVRFFRIDLAYFWNKPSLLRICGINRLRFASFFRICGINRLLFTSICPICPGIDSEESILPAYVTWPAGTTSRVVVPTRQAGN